MSTPILLLNAGSSSIKYQVIDADNEDVLASGIIQRIGDESGTIDHRVDGQTHHQTRGFPNHGRALTVLVQMFDEFGPKLASVKAVGHRIVHGGSLFNSTTVINDEVIEHLREVSPLAPLHNPPGIAGIEAAMRSLPDVPHVAIFDTAFFSTLPAEAYTYAIPHELAAEHGIRKYGFHGTSHSFVSRKVAEVLGPDDDITHFEYVKRSNRELGPALVGIELGNPGDYDELRKRMETSGINAEVVAFDSPFFRFLL